ncbi:hypothetical protein H6P81_005002 [Aristolochia fimbriata]|uniref:Gamma-tubulin complex component n=1 Tax=Aristolochia fimbriata TaxID=158543 RepID=A0AAV7ETR3_ARIFI|nr:hypothetical protein H6P81_005002 [Aristolochia fimbriata]
MASDSGFSLLMRDLKLREPCLRPRPWESVPSESGEGYSNHSRSSSTEPAYDALTVSEADLVRLVINGLQGVESALHSIEMLSAAFCSSPSDRTFHRTPNLWHRSSSTYALARILKSVGNSGLVHLFLRSFVDFSLGLKEAKVCRGSVGESTIGPPFSLVNQAFAVAVGKILEEYHCALNSLQSSVGLRRSGKSEPAQVTHGRGCLMSVAHSEISLLEVYLHTKELQNQMEALGSICLFTSTNLAFLGGGLPTKIVEHLNKFPRGADLLTYLYIQLQDADPVHRPLLQFLFVRSCEPYCGFIKSWIYRADIIDPYEEFIVECFEETESNFHGSPGYCTRSLTFTKERDGSAVPCFLKDVCCPLLRAGQQLQVLVKLLNMCTCVISEDQSFGEGSNVSFPLSNMEEFLPYWNDSSCDHASSLLPLVFSKRDMDAMVHKREKMYIAMHERLSNLLPRLNIKCWQMNSSVVPQISEPRQLILDGDWDFPPSGYNQWGKNLGTGVKASDVSSASDDFSFVSEDLGSSECSSVNSLEEQGNSDVSVELHKVLSATKSGYLCKSDWQTEVSTQGCSSSEWLLISNSTTERTCEKIILDGKKDPFDDAYCCRVLEGVDQPDYCLPLGLPKHLPSADEGQSFSHLSFQFPGISQYARSTDIFKSEGSYSAQDFRSSDAEPGKNLLETEKLGAPSQNFLVKYKTLSMNPMLKKEAWSGMTCYSKERDLMGWKNSFLPYFDFTSLGYSSRINGVFSEASLGCRFQAEIPGDVHSLKATLEDVAKYVAEQKKGDGSPAEIIKKSVMSSTDSKYKQHEESSQKGFFQTAASGGSKWESMLNYSDKNNFISGKHNHKPAKEFETPLDVIVDRCIVKEILLQYKYISSFTIKVLEEGFDLQRHLLALRRYHFMELADWADSFIRSLWHHQLFISEGKQRISEIQGFLDLALQRSSCESDEHKDRLFVYAKGEDKMSSACGIHAFDFIALGYRVDWPISIVLTPDALKIYAEIFSFLTKVKLAVFSLNDVWCSFKNLMHQRNGPKAQEIKHFNILMKMRQQINHFVSTLQQYVLSQLSHVSWCRFLQSLTHQVKDVVDLELVHMTYLEDSLHISFLSPETKYVASIIEGILQCSLDFQSCFARSDYKDRSLGDGTSMLTLINFSQIFMIKASFEKHLKDLYFCYMKSPKHAEFGLSRFWERLNYNDFYSNIFGQVNMPRTSIPVLPVVLR